MRSKSSMILFLLSLFNGFPSSWVSTRSYHFLPLFRRWPPAVGGCSPLMVVRIRCLISLLICDKFKFYFAERYERGIQCREKK
ncbi:hypothetical protein HYC85_010586 [Camellia sinensis]|uniref:Uncharacterized protein n=1 Tax=Camellia sinensis TaxID=4442 RepID=A0A7J7HIA2_CAMSI|nr:hypothetical protein HYC85_010586 [Camellia sinensis]